MHPEITPAYHMNKKHWNSISVSGNVPDQLILTLVDHSYELVLATLSQKIKSQLLP
jgi:predicted DNA-binding protein (MmcQ/YjbR family)